MWHSEIMQYARVREERDGMRQVMGKDRDRMEQGENVGE